MRRSVLIGVSFPRLRWRRVEDRLLLITTIAAPELPSGVPCGSGKTDRWTYFR
jgi:hypothetical protein